ncbi:uncharacterized protein M6B38_315370 [Iris pallida]|uniref:Uncharacterized protein n=1 Tax=Iris pallida TaxID=29817 RepID=A0AAX6HEE6_IRIPA|nr:uncharacterized protein M6B38_315370 [Iris pallida]
MGRHGCGSPTRPVTGRCRWTPGHPDHRHPQPTRPIRTRARSPSSNPPPGAGGGAQESHSLRLGGDQCLGQMRILFHYCER